MIQLLTIYGLLVVATGITSLVAGTRHNAMQKIPGRTIALLSLLCAVALIVMHGEWGHTRTLTLFKWGLPFASGAFGCDPLSCFFMLPLLILAACCSLYGSGYLHGHRSGRLQWFFLALLISGMTGVLLARNALFFIIAWEIMSLSSFFLVINDKESEASLKAGWIYFIAAHIGTAFMLLLFFKFSSLTGSFDFSAWEAATIGDSAADALFILALVAFGLKAGFIPFHVWLPMAHPAAPSHVSALMSGIMIKMGIYGILRILVMIAPFHLWWGVLLIGIGCVSGILGVLFAIGQHDIKRMLAYSSVENIGIILLGLGLGITGLSYGRTSIALFGFAGGLLHLLNHSLFKGLLFLGAGAVIRQTGTGAIDRMGGLLKRMPKTGPAILIGSAAICGMPFFNGFISEIMIYVASIESAVMESSPALGLIGLCVTLSLALIGGLAVACFTNFFGIQFLGEPRSDEARQSKEVPLSMRLALWSLAILCLATGICMPVVLPLLKSPLSLFISQGGAAEYEKIASFTMTTSAILLVCAAFFLVAACTLQLLCRGKKQVNDEPTWDCGYALADPSIQYSGSSFGAPIVNFFGKSLSADKSIVKDSSCFPQKNWSFSSSVDDWFLSGFFTPVAKCTGRLFSFLEWFQNGKTEHYILYITLAVLGLIVWKFFR